MSPPIGTHDTGTVAMVAAIFKVGEDLSNQLMGPAARTPYEALPTSWHMQRARLWLDAAYEESEVDHAR